MNNDEIRNEALWHLDPGNNCNPPEKEPVVLSEGHGRTDVSCIHGSRWIWWSGFLPDSGGWRQVIWAPGCDCEEPPNPFTEDE